MVIVILESDYDYWRNLHSDRQRYESEKQRVAETVVGLVDRYIPGIAAQVEVVDIATPMTYERYTGNWRGSMEGWLPNTRNLTTHLGRTTPGPCR